LAYGSSEFVYQGSLIVSLLSTLAQTDDKREPKFYVSGRTANTASTGKESASDASGASKREDGGIGEAEAEHGGSTFEVNERDEKEDMASTPSGSTMDVLRSGEASSRGRTSKSKQRHRAYFEDHVCTIEIQWGDKLVRTCFPRPQVCGFLTDESKQAAHERLDYTVEDGQLIRDFFAMATDLTDEMEHKMKLAGNYFLRVTTHDYFEILPYIAALVINFLMLISMHKSVDDTQIPTFKPAGFKDAIFVLGVIQLVS